MTEIIPAILTNDESDFKLKYSHLYALGEHFSKLHIDFIDGEFLPEKTLLPDELSFFHTKFVLMGHFMAFNPSKYFAKCKDLGFEWVIIHFEAFKIEDDLIRSISEARKLGLKIGISLNPETPLHKLGKVLHKVDLVQVMGVHPGAQGRQFEVSVLEKIKELKNLTPHVIISVDGGIKLGVATKCVQAGADILIIGSGILHATHPKEALEAFKREIELI